MPAPTGRRRSTLAVLVAQPGATRLHRVDVSCPSWRPGSRLRCLARHPAALGPASTIEVVTGDLFEPASLTPPSPASRSRITSCTPWARTDNYRERVRFALPQPFGAVARQAVVRRIVYLGGPPRAKRHSSAHLESRLRRRRILRAVACRSWNSGVRCDRVGQFSFEPIRALCRGPCRFGGPRALGARHWRSQSVSSRDVLAYSCGCTEPA